MVYLISTPIARTTVPKMITGDHVRMIRGALRLSVREFAALAGMGKDTVSEMERGKRRIQSGTQDKIRAAFDQYLEFLEPIEGVRGAGIVMRWGVQPIGDDASEDAETPTPKKRGLQRLMFWNV